MSNHDIDKYFRDNLSGITEPTSADDLKAFTTLASKRKKIVWPYFLAGFILLSTITTFAYISINQNNKELTSTINSNTNASQKNANQTAKEANPESNSTIEKIDSSGNDQFKTETTLLENPTLLPTEKMGNESEENISNLASTATRNSASTQENTNQNTSRLSNDSSVDSNDNQSSDITATTLEHGNNNSQPSKDAEKNLSQNKGKTTPTTNQRNSTESINPTSNKNERAAFEENLATIYPAQRETMEADFQLTESISAAGIEINTAPELNENATLSSQNTIKKWSLDIFAQYEFNTELGGIPSAGFISNWQRNKWKLGAGLAIGQTGSLNWTDSREDVTYGFDVYESTDELKTKNFTFISMPILISRSIHARGDAFIGISPSLIVNASQAYFNAENSDQSSGYHYQFGTPDLLLFLNLGYTYSINDVLKLDLGIDYSPQNWDAISGKPFGAFARIKYNIR